MNANEENEVVWMPQRTFALKRGRRKIRGSPKKEEEEDGRMKKEVKKEKAYEATISGCQVDDHSKETQGGRRRRLFPSDIGALA